jgi:hypothetical protein
MNRIRTMISALPVSNRGRLIEGGHEAEPEDHAWHDVGDHQRAVERAGDRCLPPRQQIADQGAPIARYASASSCPASS